MRCLVFYFSSSWSSVEMKSSVSSVELCHSNLCLFCIMENGFLLRLYLLGRALFVSTGYMCVSSSQRIIAHYLLAQVISAPVVFLFRFLSVIRMLCDLWKCALVPVSNERNVLAGFKNKRRLFALIIALKLMMGRGISMYYSFSDSYFVCSSLIKSKPNNITANYEAFT